MCIEVSRARILRIRINVGGCARGADDLVKKGMDARVCGRGVTATRWLKAWVVAVVFMAVLAMVDLLACGAACVFYPVRFYDEVTAASSEFGIENTLIFAVINTESHFNARAKSGAGAMGLMQIMPKRASTSRAN